LRKGNKAPDSSEQNEPPPSSTLVLDTGAAKARSSKGWVKGGVLALIILLLAGGGAGAWWLIKSSDGEIERENVKPGRSERLPSVIPRPKTHAKRDNWWGDRRPTNKPKAQPRPKSIVPDENAGPPEPSRSAVVIVNPRGNGGDFKSISAAILNTPVGGKIVVQPGIYNEVLRINKTIQIVGDGPDRELVRIIVANGPCAVISASATLRRLTFINLGKGDRGDCIQIRGGSPKLIRNRIVSLGGVGILVIGGSPYIASNSIENSRGHGILLQSAGVKTVIESNAIVGNKRTGVRLEGDSRGRLMWNRVFKNGLHGIVIDTPHMVVVEHNRVDNNSGIGLITSAKSNTMIRKNMLRDNKLGATQLHRESKGRFEGNVTE
jgi:Right handed beta helix region